MPFHDAFWGVHPIVPTPFLDDGSLDLDSVRRLVDATVAAKAQGIAVLGFMGEAHKLTGAERRAVLATAVEQSAGRLAVWVGVRGLGTAACVEQVQEAEELGADAVFVAPIAPQSDAALEHHYRTVAAATSLPMALHDYPSSFGITLSVDLIGRLARDGVAPYIKAEDPPVIGKQRAVLAAAEQRIGVFGGLGGAWVYEELEVGAAGVMTGLAFPEVLVEIVARFAAGDRDGAAKVFDRALPLIRYEFQPGIGVALRKHVFRRRGVFATEFVRRPASPVDAATLAGFEAVVERCGLRIDTPGWVDPPVAGPVPESQPPRG
ncbi:MAG: dihydrodipicolinate synthase family protein [Trueperaceae bacterium]|nr:dihydrodipicolinate synthase family protein [Trueperaceae bacterium]